MRFEYDHRILMTVVRVVAEGDQRLNYNWKFDRSLRS